MSARQASPDAPGLWWRDGGDGADLWEVSRHAHGLRASAVVGDDTLRDLSPRDGVWWARCVPPNDAEVTALRARVEALTAELAGRDAEIATLEPALRDARADHAAAEEHLAGIVRRWETADHDSQSLADLHVPWLRAEIEEARDGREGEWWTR